MEQLNATISKFANSALRTLCFAYRDVSPSEVEELAIKTTKLPDQNLICIAIVGIKDPCRFGVPESVARCQQAGIKVRIIRT
jgi:Ca2+-transporting ATPase